MKTKEQLFIERREIVVDEHGVISRKLKTGRWKIFSGSDHGNGNLSLGYCHMGEGIKLSYSRVVWTYFNGPIPPKTNVIHINGENNDNRIDNLELLCAEDRLRNVRDGRITRRINMGERISRIESILKLVLFKDKRFFRTIKCLKCGDTVSVNIFKTIRHDQCGNCDPDKFDLGECGYLFIDLEKL